MRQVIAVDPLEEKRSKFYAFGCRIHSKQDLEARLKEIRSIKIVQRAKHSPFAFRFHNTQGSHSDGETGAGPKLLHLLEQTNTTNTLVLVSRHFGGIKLGPKRFQLINQAAHLVIKQLSQK
ncbi:ribosomal protein S5 domain 2-type protein [Gorgonomyces haynaldii]|nr:ribosomal protein S5 domain 2-type protein [Gorgonomyces haynaldii]